MPKVDRPFGDTLKWTLLGFVAAMVLLLSYHLAFHQKEAETDIHPISNGVDDG